MGSLYRRGEMWWVKYWLLRTFGEGERRGGI